jgi:hypothetical protein
MTPCFRRQPALSHPVSRGPSSRVGGEFPPPRSQAPGPWSRRGSGSKRSWKRWQKEARTLDAYGAVSGPANAALRAAALLAVKKSWARSTSTRRLPRSRRRCLRSLARRRLLDLYKARGRLSGRPPNSANGDGANGSWFLRWPPAELPLLACPHGGRCKLCDAGGRRPSTSNR